MQRLLNSTTSSHDKIISRVDIDEEVEEEKVVNALLRETANAEKEEGREGEEEVVDKGGRREGGERCRGQGGCGNRGRTGCQMGRSEGRASL